MGWGKLSFSCIFVPFFSGVFTSHFKPKDLEVYAIGDWLLAIDCGSYWLSTIGDWLLAIAYCLQPHLVSCQAQFRATVQVARLPNCCSRFLQNLSLWVQICSGIDYIKASIHVSRKHRTWSMVHGASPCSNEQFLVPVDDHLCCIELNDSQWKP